MNAINIEKLKEQLQQGTFYYHKSNLVVTGKVYNIVSYDDGELEIFFTGGIVSVYKDKLDKVICPLNTIGVFKWCYLLKNSDDESIGYIGLKEEDKENANGQNRN